MPVFESAEQFSRAPASPVLNPLLFPLAEQFERAHPAPTLKPWVKFVVAEQFERVHPLLKVKPWLPLPEAFEFMTETLAMAVSPAAPLLSRGLRLSSPGKTPAGDDTPDDHINPMVPKTGRRPKPPGVSRRSSTATDMNVCP